MPEMPDVLTGEVIASEWGNDIRNRTLQRYATAAQRTTEHPTPAEGDLSYLEDSNSIWMYNGSLWQLVGPDLEVDGSVEVAGSLNLTGTLTAYATVNLTIPTTWASWKCEAYATFGVATGAASVSYRIRIDGTDQQTLSFNSSAIAVFLGAVGGRRTGMTTTGSRAISLMAIANSGNCAVGDRYLYARAARTA